MSWEHLHRVRKVAPLCRSPKEVLVLYVLADEYLEDEDRWPTLDEIVNQSGLARSSVVSAIDMLEEDLLLKVDRRVGANNRYTFTFEAQLRLRPTLVPEARRKRAIGFAVTRRKPMAGADEKQYAPDTALDVAGNEKQYASHTAFEETPDQKQYGSHTALDTSSDEKQYAPDTAKQYVSRTASDSSPYVLRSSFPTATEGGTETATAAPRLPTPWGRRITDEEKRAKEAKQRRLDKLRRRVAGHAVGLLLKPDRGVALIGEPVTTYDTLVAATKEACGKKRIEGYHEVLDAMCFSVWWRKTPYGKAVIAGNAPRPRDLGKGPR